MIKVSKLEFNNLDFNPPGASSQDYIIFYDPVLTVCTEEPKRPCFKTDKKFLSTSNAACGVEIQFVARFITHSKFSCFYGGSLGQNTSQNPKHVPESKNTSQNPLNQLNDKNK